MDSSAMDKHYEAKGFVVNPEGKKVPVWQIDGVTPINTLLDRPNGKIGTDIGFFFYVEHASGKMTLFHFPFQQPSMVGYANFDAPDYQAVYNKEKAAVVALAKEAMEVVEKEMSAFAKAGRVDFRDAA